MRLRRLLITFIFALCLSVISACATTSSVDPVDMYKDKAEMQLFKDGERAMLKRRHEDAISHFQTLMARYPFGEYARQAQLDIIYAYYQQDDTASALAAATRYIHMYPRGSNVDYAYYMRGLIEFYENRSFFEKYFPVDFAKRDIVELHQAYLDFDHIIRFYPNSSYYAEARQRMIYIRNLFAKQQLLIAQFYLERDSYVAAINRASDIFEHYQGSSSISQSLVIMVKAYKKLGLSKDADDVLQILRLNFTCEEIKDLLNDPQACS